jgi:hypothetical protein
MVLNPTNFEIKAVACIVYIKIGERMGRKCASRPETQELLFLSMIYWSLVERRGYKDLCQGTLDMSTNALTG